MRKHPTILLRAGWAFGNIGDIAITPGMIRLIEQYVPEARIVLHPASFPYEFKTYLSDRFPHVETVDAELDQLGEPMSPVLREAFEQADLYLHASGPTVAHGHEPYDGPVRLEGWRAFDWNSTIRPLLPFYVAREMGVPFGAFGPGVNFVGSPAELVIKSILNDAAFFYTRETDSLRYSRSLGVDVSTMGFTPDCTFAFDMRDEEGADRLMERHGLERGRFLVVILRSSQLAFTTPEREAAHAWQLRELIRHWIDRTGLPVFLCPETRPDVEPTGRLLREPLPPRYKAMVHNLGAFWMPCLATSMYERAHSLLTMDHHSAIMALSVGTPTLHPRDPMAGRKGQVFPDLGLGDWLFDINRTTPDDIRPALDELIDQPRRARARVDRAMRTVRELHAQTMGVVRRVALGLPVEPAHDQAVEPAGGVTATPNGSRRQPVTSCPAASPR